MSKYDGASRYSNQLTIKENIYCEYIVIEKLPLKDAFLKTYPELKNCNPVTIHAKIQKLNNKPKIQNRIHELEVVEQAKNQTENKHIEIFENNKIKMMCSKFLDYIDRCKQNDDRANEIKGLEAICKLYNLYNDNNTETQKQINQIIINNNDVTLAIDAIQQLANNNNN